MLQYDGPVIGYLAKVGDMILLNILWLLCCLPIITIGPATIAAHYVALKFVRDEGTSVIRMFFKSFRQNFRQGLLLGLIAMAAGGVLVIDLWLILTGKISFMPMLQLVILAFLLLLAFLYLLIMIYVWPLMARFENTIRKTIFNAVVLAIANIRSTMMMLCWDVALVVMAVWAVAFIPQLAVLCTAFGIPSLFILNAIRLRPILDKYREYNHRCTR